MCWLFLRGLLSQCWQARPWFLYILYYYTLFTNFLGIKTHGKSFRRFILSSKHSKHSMSKMTGIRNSYMEVFKKVAQKTRQHCSTKFGKKPKITIFRCLKNYVKIKLEIWNFAGCLEVDQIDCKKSFKFQEYREVGFTIDCRDTYILYTYIIYIFRDRRFASEL